MIILHFHCFQCQFLFPKFTRNSAMRGYVGHNVPTYLRESRLPQNALSADPTANMASKAKTVVQKLHAVTQVKSCIGRPWWEKRTIKALGFSRLHQTIIHKNIPTVNGALRSVKHLLEIKPVEIVEEDPTEGQRNGQEGLFLRQNGHFHLNKFKNFLENNPNMKEMIYKRRKQAIWERRRS